MGKEGRTERQGELAGSWSCLQNAVSRGVGEGREVRSCARCHNPSCCVILSWRHSSSSLCLSCTRPLQVAWSGTQPTPLPRAQASLCLLKTETTKLACG